ncbi:MAG: RNA polymerase sigma factor [Candidatus Cryptobacteroides sp.]
MSEDKAVSLIRKCIQGDRKAQRKMYELLAPRFFPVCIRYVGDRAVAEDILQEGFVALFAKLETYSGSGSFDGWARRIFINASLMYLRKNDVLKDSEDISEIRKLSSDSGDALERIGFKELIEVIATMPPGFRTVFNMYVMEGFTHKEIAQELGITESTSRTQLSRGRIWLQNRLEKMYGKQK